MNWYCKPAKEFGYVAVESDSTPPGGFAYLGPTTDRNDWCNQSVPVAEPAASLPRVGSSADLLICLVFGVLVLLLHRRICN